MRRRLPLSIGLAILCACVVAGTAAGQGSVIGVGESGVQVDIPNGQNLDQLEVLPQCSNRNDDDGDGLVDLADPDCSNPLDATESGSNGLPEEPAPPAPPADGGGNGGAGGGGSDVPADDGITGGGGGGGGSTIGSEGRFNAGGGSGGRGTSADPKPNGGRGNGNHSGGIDADDGREPMEEPPDRRPDGAPTNANPGLTIADFGPAPIGVPNFIIDQFSIPPFLLPIYQSCGTQYGIPWQVLASAAELLTPGGTAVISVPNVQYWDTVRQLVVRGTWPRHEEGIFDRSHLRWFTGADAAAMMSRAGVPATEVERQYRLRPGDWRTERAARLVARGPMRPFLVYQYVMAGRKAPAGPQGG